MSSLAILEAIKHYPTLVRTEIENENKSDDQTTGDLGIHFECNEKRRSRSDSSATRKEDRVAIFVIMDKSRIKE